MIPSPNRTPMKTETSNIPFIVVHMIPPAQWGRMTYRQKKQYHHLVTSMGKKIRLKPLHLPVACIDVAFVGPERTARDNGALYTFLQDLWTAHPAAEIVYADQLVDHSGPSPLLMVTRRLLEYLPDWLQRVLLYGGNLFTLRSLLPLV